MASVQEGTSIGTGTDKVDLPSPDDTSLREASPLDGSSDGEGSERNTRERLKKASLTGLSQQSKSTPAHETATHPLAESTTIDQVSPPKENGGLRGRPSKKRSFEDLQNDDHTGPTENGSAGLPDSKRFLHKRMRSRDISHGHDPEQLGRFEEEMGSPLKEESDDDAHRSPGGAGVLVDLNSHSDSNAQTDSNTVDEKTVEDGPTNQPSSTTSTTLQPPVAEESTEQSIPAQHNDSSTLSPKSGFANASSASPFGGVKSPTQPPQDPPGADADASAATSTSAFASSGLSAFASSEKSPFGAASTKKATGGFGGAAAGGFGGATSSGFGSAHTGFGGISTFGPKLSSGFGSTGGFGSPSGFGGGLAPKPFGTGITSFASTAAANSTFGKSKPFGAKDEAEDEEADEGHDGDEKPDQDDDEKQDSRFHQQEVETGEEDEEVFFQARARLYHFEKEWKERGTGNIKINVHYEQEVLAEAEPAEGDEEPEQDPEAGSWASEIRKARVIMRADGVHRVILNSPVFKGMKVGTIEGDEPIGKTMYLTGLEDGQPRLFQIRIAKEDVLKDLYYKIQNLKEELQ